MEKKESLKRRKGERCCHHQNSAQLLRAVYLVQDHSDDCGPTDGLGQHLHLPYHRRPPHPFKKRRTVLMIKPFD